MQVCIAAAGAASRAVSIANIDDAGGPLSFQRMDGARAHTIDLAQRKARASAMVGVPTSVIEAMVRDRPKSAALAVARGGLPAMQGADCVGAIGVSGATPEVDDGVAQAGLAALAVPLARI